MAQLISSPTPTLAGAAPVPGDKSISHRALILGGLAVGESRIEGLLEGDDVLRTAAAMRAFGARIERLGEGRWRTRGVGVGGLAEPADVLDLGNSGTGARLLIGLAAGAPITSFFTGDGSLRGRPMNRVMAPLAQMGARFQAREGGLLPLAVIGARPAQALDYTLPVASAQVKSAILLAGLNAAGETRVVEPKPTRDHSENLLRHFGAAVRTEPREDGGREVVLVGEPELAPADVQVPADPSSAAFLMVAAALVEGAEVTVANVGLNPLRTGLIDCLVEMGARLEIRNRRELQHEPVGDVVVRGGPLKGIVVPPERAPTMIDEYPVLAVAAAFAEGQTLMRGAEELRVKESDRIAAMAEGLAGQGVRLEVFDDGLAVEGAGGPAPAGGGLVRSFHDHRIAMAFLVYGMAARGPVRIDDDAMIRTSFPSFVALANGLGARIEAVPG